MTSYRTLILAVTALALGAGCASSPADGAAMTPEQEARMMAEMTKLATPGPEHAELQKSVGRWEHSYRMHWSPNEPWTETKGKSEVTSLLGGRYIMEDNHFEMMGMPMEGISITGFDNQSGEYTSLWSDSMSTWWTSSHGKKGADGTINFKGTMTDAAGTRPFRMTYKSTGGTAHMEMFDTMPPHGEVLVMTVDSRKVDAKP